MYRYASSGDVNNVGSTVNVSIMMLV